MGKNIDSPKWNADPKLEKLKDQFYKDKGFKKRFFNFFAYMFKNNKTTAKPYEAIKKKGKPMTFDELKKLAILLYGEKKVETAKKEHKLNSEQIVGYILMKIINQVLPLAVKYNKKFIEKAKQKNLTHIKGFDEIYEDFNELQTDYKTLKRIFG